MDIEKIRHNYKMYHEVKHEYKKQIDNFISEHGATGCDYLDHRIAEYNFYRGAIMAMVANIDVEIFADIEIE